MLRDDPVEKHPAGWSDIGQLKSGVRHGRPVPAAQPVPGTNEDTRITSYRDWGMTTAVR